MARAVRAITDRRILWEKAWLLAEGARVGDGLVDVESVIALPRVSPDVGDAEAGIPTLVLHRQVVLLGVRNAQVGIDGLRRGDRRRTCDAGCREDARQGHCRVVRRICKTRLVDELGHA